MPTTSARVSIAGLLAVVALCGVGFAALASPSALWVSAVVSLNLALLVLALIRAVYHREPLRRAFWGGFLAAGLVYLLASRLPWFGESGLGEELATTAFLDIAYAQIEPSTPPPPTPAPGMMMMGGYGSMMSGTGMMSGGMMGMGGGTAPTPGPPPTRWSVWTQPDRATVHLPVSGPGPASNWSLPKTFARIGHSLFSLLCGIMGGSLARRYRRGAGTHDGEPIG